MNLIYYKYESRRHNCHSISDVVTAPEDLARDGGKGGQPGTMIVTCSRACIFFAVAFLEQPCIMGQLQLSHGCGDILRTKTNRKTHNWNGSLQSDRLGKAVPKMATAELAETEPEMECECG